MGDWSILGRFLVEVQNHSTVIGKIWLTVLLIFRILLVTLVGDTVYGDEQSKFICNTLQPGCNNVCYDTFAPVSHLRFWVFQIVLVSTPSIFYIIYALHKITKDEKVRTERAQALLHRPHVRQSGGGSDIYLGGKLSNGLQAEESPSEESSLEQSLLQDDYREVDKDPTEHSGQILLIYIIHVFLRAILEIMFLVGQYYMFGFKVPFLFRCKAYPCPTQTDCFVSRATEKTIFLNFMFGTSLGCFFLNIAELHYLGWVYILRMLYTACFQCCEPKGKPYVSHSPLQLRLQHSMRSRLVLQSSSTTLSHKTAASALLSHGPSISFETDSTLEYTSKTNPDEKKRTGIKLTNMAKLSSKKSWL
ncbi:gap junction delta-2 protein [Neoarius graeffei]|uniref:gap junction delta-2 protein n=1 Tax=Neoarius graeffei TaxID=443677 RepID=UPI00298D1F80|nr:gap junction delta-2 protein [Neoarius graeffei]